MIWKHPILMAVLMGKASARLLSTRTEETQEAPAEAGAMVQDHHHHAHLRKLDTVDPNGVVVGKKDFGHRLLGDSCSSDSDCDLTNYLWCDLENTNTCVGGGNHWDVCSDDSHCQYKCDSGVCVEPSLIRYAENGRCLVCSDSSADCWPSPCVVNDQLQLFWYSKATNAIRHKASGNKCLGVVYNNNIALKECNDGAGDQVWYMDQLSRLQNFGGGCLEFWSGIATLRPCDSQTMIVAGDFFPPASLNSEENEAVIKTVEDSGHCLEMHSSSYDVHATNCALDNVNQYFYHDASTNTIRSKANGRCLHANGDADDVSFQACNGSSQQRWFMDGYGHLIPSSNKYKCIQEEDGNEVGMNDWGSHYATSQHQFALPFNFFHGRVLQFKSGEKCMVWDVGSSFGNVVEWTCDAVNHKLFYYDPPSQSIRSLYQAGYCLNVNEATGNIHFYYKCNNHANQRWLMDSSNRLVSIANHKCLTSVGGTNGHGIELQNCGSSTKQALMIPHTFFPAYGPGVIQVKSNKACLSVDLGSAGKSVSVEACNGSSHQLFKYDPFTETIRSGDPAFGDYVLHYHGPYDDVVMYTYGGWSNQRWYLDDKSRLRSRWNEDKCLGRDASGGDNVKIFNCRDSDHQKFTFPTKFFGDLKEV